MFDSAWHDYKVSLVQLNGAVPEINRNATAKNKKPFIFVGM